MATTVLIADDHEITVQGLIQAIEKNPAFQVVGTASSGLGAIAQAKTLLPDLVVLDFAMPDANGLEVFLEVRRWSPNTRAAIVTGSPSPGLFRQLADAGVNGIFEKSTSPTELVAGLESVARGVDVYCTAAQKAMQSESSNVTLSSREVEVLHGISLGLTNTKIGERLGISTKTVESHRSAVMRKLDVHSTASLVVKAVKEGLITL